VLIILLAADVQACASRDGGRAAALAPPLVPGDVREHDVAYPREHDKPDALRGAAELLPELAESSNRTAIPGTRALVLVLRLQQLRLRVGSR
jgi:hypothetical protein